MIADVHFSEEEYQRLLQMKKDCAMDYLNGQELPEEIKINYYLEHLLDD